MCFQSNAGLEEYETMKEKKKKKEKDKNFTTEQEFCLKYPFPLICTNVLIRQNVFLIAMLKGIPVED